MTGPVRLQIKNISFHPLHGFLLKNASLSIKENTNDNSLIKAKLVDIDIEWLPLLLWKQLIFSKFSIFNGELHIERNSSGKWNFQQLLSTDNHDSSSSKKPAFIIKAFRLDNCNIQYMDVHKEQNSLTRNFKNVNLLITNPSKSLYKLILSEGTRYSPDESILLNLDFNKENKSLSGSVNIYTKNLAQYWNYYLDDFLDPWHLSSDTLKLNGKFSYKDKVLSLNGQYTITDGLLKYGDLSLKGNGHASHKLKYVKGVPDSDSSKINLSLENVTSLTGDFTFIDKGKCTVEISGEKITIDNLTGTVHGHPVNLSGIFDFDDPKYLKLNGTIGDIYNSIRIEFATNNKGTANIKSSLKDSIIDISADITDAKDMQMSMTISGKTNLPDLSNYLPVDKYKIKGAIDLKGNLNGELDKVSSLNGNIDINFKDFSLMELSPESFSMNFSVKNGLFDGNIPKKQFYNGTLLGKIKLDKTQMGVELNISNLDIEQFTKSNHKLNGMKGLFTGSVAALWPWTNFLSLYGGGYAKLSDADLWSTPGFSHAEEGIKSITKKKEMPKLKLVEGNFELKDQKMGLQKTLCKAENLTLDVSGNLAFSGIADFTVGVNIMGKGFFRMARQIILPVTIGFDLVQNSIQVSITGPLNDLTQKTVIQPKGWLTSFFPSGNPKPNRYTLKKLWDKPESRKSR